MRCMLGICTRLVWVIGALLLFNQCATPSTTPMITSWKPAYYERLTYQSYRTEPLFQESLNFNAIDYPRLHAAIFFATNEARVRYGRDVLAYHPLLERAARHHAQRMVEQNFFAHENPFEAELRTVNQRVQLAGVLNPQPTENLAIYVGIDFKPGEPVYRSHGGLFSRTSGGPPIPNHTYLSFAEAVVDFWLHSPKHHANMLAPEGRQMGCGAAFYWGKQGFPRFKTVQVFQWFEPAKP
jgi:uncharacterized protein YkwD